MQWNVNANLAEAEALVSTVEERLGGSGVEKVAAKLAEALHQESDEAFGTKRDPITGAQWTPPSPATLATPGFKSLLERTGAMRAAVRSGFGLNPAGAVAFLNVEAGQLRKALIHIYGVQAKKSRTYVRSRTGRTESRRRLRPGQVMPARGFVGLPKSKIAEITGYAEEVMVP